MVIDNRLYEYVDELIKRFPLLECCKEDIIKAFSIIVESYNHKGKLLVAGNGGSASDAEHIVGELMKSFCKKRNLPSYLSKKIMALDCAEGEIIIGNLEFALPAIALSAQEALLTAYSNDRDFTDSYAQQVLGYGIKGDVFLGISTTGNSPNVIHAAIVAKALDMKVIGLTGNGGGKLAQLSDARIVIPETSTYKIQEYHLPTYHCLCRMIEDYYWGESSHENIETSGI